MRPGKLFWHSAPLDRSTIRHQRSTTITPYMHETRINYLIAKLTLPVAIDVSLRTHCMNEGTEQVHERATLGALLAWKSLCNLSHARAVRRNACPKKRAKLMHAREYLPNGRGNAESQLCKRKVFSQSPPPAFKTKSAPLPLCLSSSGPGTDRRNFLSLRRR